MNKIWVTDSGIIHHRKPEMDATEYVQLTKTTENVSCENVTNVGVTKPAGEVGEALRFVKSIKIENVFYKDKPSTESQFRDAINTIERALAQQQPDAELLEALEALKALLAGLEKTTWSSWQTTAYFQKEEEYAREVVARAEQKGGE